MEEREQYEIPAPPEASEQRLDSFLALHFEDYSRTILQDWIRHGLVRLNGTVIVKPNRRLKGGELIFVEVPEPLPSTVDPEPLDLPILYQDDDLAVINKPAGMAAHPSGSTRTGTVVNALLYHLDHLSGICGVMKPGIVHRLDKGTSGLMLVAKNDRTHKQLARQFAQRTVRKKYVAVVKGHLTERSGVISDPLGRHPIHRQKFAVIASGKPSETAFEVIHSLELHSYVAAYPKTGRTHQIRVHMARLGYPIAGDTMYGYRLRGQTIPKFQKALEEYPGFLLHAERISFQHPRTGEEVEFEISPPAPYLAMLKILLDEYLGRA